MDLVGILIVTMNSRKKSHGLNQKRRAGRLVFFI